jgi:hypothetical protein
VQVAAVNLRLWPLPMERSRRYTPKGCRGQVHTSVSEKTNFEKNKAKKRALFVRHRKEAETTTFGKGQLVDVKTRAKTGRGHTPKKKMDTTRIVEIQ